ncbi:MAG: hypothetical protein Kow0098_20380 [Ignavibacteriaceae bacterium]
MNISPDRVSEIIKNLSRSEREQIFEKLRGEVDEIDKVIIDSLKKRLFLASLIGKIKQSLGFDTYNPEREKEILNRLTGRINDKDLSLSLQRIYERIVDESRAVQKKNLKDIPDDIFNLISSKTSGKINLKNLLTKWQTITVITFFLLLIILFYYTFFTPNHFDQPAPVKFDIHYGENFSEITERLYEQGIIPSEFNFRVAGFIYGAESKIRAARYYIPDGISYLDLLDLFIEGECDYLRNFEFRSGLTIKWLAFKLQRDLLVDSSGVVNTANDSSFIHKLGLNIPTLEGYLLPDKYLLYERSTPEEVLTAFYMRFQEFWTDSLKDQLNKYNLNIHQLLTLASIVKGETDKVEEMPVIAGVYHNRLKKGMKLQADPTIQYLLPDGWRRLLYEDLQIDSPFNTYMYYGLPPHPINNPGKDAILAALFPQEHNYLYFVADGKGGHKFARTYNQHLKNVREYRRWLQTQKKN